MYHWIKNTERHLWSTLNDVKLTQINATYGCLPASASIAKENSTIDFHFQHHIHFYLEHFWKQVQPLANSLLVVINNPLCIGCKSLTRAQQHVTALVSWSGNHCCQGCQGLCLQLLWEKEEEGKKNPIQNFSWSVEPHHLEKRARSRAKLPSMTTCLEQEASLWLENWLIAWYLLRTRGGFGSQYIWTRQYFLSQPETWCFKMLL